MRAKLGLFSAFSLIILMVVPAHADVLTVDIDKESFTADDKFTLSGTVSEQNGLLITAAMKGPSSEKLNRNAFATGGTFTFTSINADDLFKSEGIYTVTVFTENQQPVNGTVLKISYDNGIASMLPDFEVILNPIGNKQVDENQKLSFTASIADSEVTDEEFSLQNHPSGAKINRDTGVFSWTPTNSQSGGYIFDIIVKSGLLEDKETITVTVNDKPVVTEPPVQTTEPEPEPVLEPEPTEPGLAPFVDEARDPQSYVDRYNTEAGYKKWFDDNFAEYDSIYQAVGLEEPLLIPASFVDEARDPQSYVDRYNTEAGYKKWFDDNFAEYDSIYQAVGLEEPIELAPFVDPNIDPQYYVDRYDKETTYKEWFDKAHPDITIYQAVGLEEPEVVEEEFGECGAGTDLVDGACVIVDNSRGGCLIATATYGSEMAPQVQLLREIRDNQLMNTESGMSFMTGFSQFYYSFSPHIADMQRENPAFKEFVKISITPLLSTLPIMSHAETESEVLGYGIGVILMNLAIYFGIPAVVILQTRKYIRI